MSITNEDILSSRQLAGRVTRWHTWPMIRKPTVAEHSARVATIYVELWGMPRAEVLYYCLVHDMGELTAGDTPYGAKRLSENLARGVNEAEEQGLLRLNIVVPEINQVEFLRFKVCDLLEMWETALVEVNMGNQYAAPSMDSCETHVSKLCEELGEAAASTVSQWLLENTGDHR